MENSLSVDLEGALLDSRSKLEKRHSQPPDYFWHYTSAAGLKGILTEKVLWFTDTTFLNDSTELAYAADLVEKIISQKKNEAANSQLINEHLESFLRKVKDDRVIRQSYGLGNSAYVACFCKEGDSLHLWRAYTDNGRGYSIGVFPSVIHSNLMPLNVKFREKTSRTYLPLLCEVIYEESEQKELLSRLIDGFIKVLIRHESELQVGDVNNKSRREFSDKLYQAFYQYLCCFKHPAFHEEKEWRLLYVPDFQRINENNYESVNLHYRESRGYIVPYLEARIFGDQLAHLPFDKIISGPALDSRLAQASIYNFIKNVGSTETVIEIRPTSIPLRAL